MEPVHIPYDCVHRLLQPGVFDQAGVLEKELPVVQPGQLVVFGIPDDLGILSQLDAPLHAGNDDFGHVPALLQKVYSAQLQALDLRFFLRCQNDDREPLKLLILLQRLQHFVSCHARHIQVQHDQGQFSSVLPDLFQRFLSVGRFDDIIKPSQIMFQDLSVDLFIVCYQYGPSDIF